MVAWSGEGAGDDEGVFLRRFGTGNSAPVGVDDTYAMDQDTTLTTYGNWFDSDWTFRRRISIDNLARSSDLVDFPLLVQLDASRVDYDETQDNGADLRFIDPDGTELDYEIEEWNELGESRVWVRVPRVDGASASDYIHMYYGNAGATMGESPQMVWSNNFQAVHHLQGSLTDATANNVNGIAAESQGIVAAIGAGEQFDGDDDYISLGSNATVDDFFV